MANDDDVTLKPSDAGVLFRTEMAITQFVFGYWQVLALGTAAILLSIALFGQYRSWVRRDQRATQAALADAVEPLGMPILAVSMGVVEGAPGLPSVEDRKKVADALYATAKDARDPARCSGLLQAAELYRLAGDAKGRRTALEAALETTPGGVLGHSVSAALATLDLEEGAGDRAVERFTALAAVPEDFLAQQANIDLGLAYEQIGKKDEATKVYEAFQAKWPNSPLIEAVTERRARLQGG